MKREFINKLDKAYDLCLIEINKRKVQMENLLYNN